MIGPDHEGFQKWKDFRANISGNPVVGSQRQSMIAIDMPLADPLAQVHGNLQAAPQFRAEDDSGMGTGTCLWIAIGIAVFILGCIVIYACLPEEQKKVVLRAANKATFGMVPVQEESSCCTFSWSRMLIGAVSVAIPIWYYWGTIARWFRGDKESPGEEPSLSDIFQKSKPSFFEKYATKNNLIIGGGAGALALGGVCYQYACNSSKKKATATPKGTDGVENPEKGDKVEGKDQNVTVKSKGCWGTLCGRLRSLVHTTVTTGLTYCTLRHGVLPGLGLGGIYSWIAKFAPMNYIMPLLLFVISWYVGKGIQYLWDKMTCKK